MSPCKMDSHNLGKKADEVRSRLVRVAVANNAGHIAPSLSCVDILTVLYYRILNIKKDPEWEGRDRLIFSKSHGAYGLYVILADLGFIKDEDWETYYKGSFLKGCAERSVAHGIEAGCGALGHGLPMAVGLAAGAKIRKLSFRTYCIVGDGEMQEGSNWEGVQFAVKHGLDNLFIVVDCNGLQAMDSLSRVLSPEDFYEDLAGKFQAFGCRVLRCNGHDIPELVRTFCSQDRSPSGKPTVVLARTVKGYGIKAIENIPKFHFRVPTADELAEGVRYE